MVKQRSSFIGKVLYGSIFVVILPAMLLCWTFVLDRSIDWPVPSFPILAAVSIILGLIFIIKGMLDLTRFGHGLPMNAYPPQTFVTQGMYSLFSHPIYLGAVFLSAGIALWFQSSSGLYIITPTFALMTLSFVYGYEREDMEKRFGSVIHHYSPLFSLPLSSENKAQWMKKVAMCLRIFLPWALVGYFVDYARCTQTCTRSIYGTVDHTSMAQLVGHYMGDPLSLPDRRSASGPYKKSLLQKAIAGTLATVVGMYVYLVLPAFGIPLSNTTWNWTIASLTLVVLAMNYQFIWSTLLRISEWIANSRHDWLFADGHFRIINHSLYSGLGGAVAVGILSYVIGNPFAALVLLACGLVGAAVFAQVLWGSNMLARPYGYWGAVIGGGVGGLIVTFVFGILS